MNQEQCLRPKSLVDQSALAPSSSRVLVSEATDFGVFIARVNAGLLLLLLSPLLIVIALLVKISSQGPILYRQCRVGIFGRNFFIVKFRTMVNNAEKHTGAVLASPGDARITKVGRLLRATHLDELPQLWNIASGDMVFIGPRPERPVFVDQFKKQIPRYDDRHLVYPGITGLAQILLPYSAKPEEKICFDLTYVDARIDYRLKFQIFEATAVKMLRAILPFLKPLLGSKDYRVLLEAWLNPSHKRALVKSLP